MRFLFELTLKLNISVDI